MNRSARTKRIALLGTVCLLVLLLGLVSCAGTGAGSGEDFYLGQVIDIDTLKPMAEVLVVFIWERDVYLPNTNFITRELHAVTEVVTDGNGNFEGPAAPETTVGPSVVEVRLKDPVFFAPGYFFPYKVRTKGEPLRDPTFIYLKRADDPRNALEPGLSPSFPYSRTPRLLEALNKERGKVGLPSIQPSQEAK